MPTPKGGLPKASCPKCGALIAYKKDRQPYRHACLVTKSVLRCVSCARDLPSESFYRDRNRPRGRVARCKACYSEMQSTVVRMKPWRREAEAKRNALTRGIEWAITRDQFMAFWQKPCFYCGVAIPTVGIDRIDNSQSYVVGNLIPCCGTCNFMKADRSASEYFEHCARVVATLAPQLVRSTG